MNVVDSSGWLEYFAGGPHAGTFAKPIETPRSLVVPTISLHEVFNKVLQQRGENEAMQTLAVMEQGQVVDLDRTTAISAAELSTRLRLPMADSFMLATAQRHGAILWTQDADFEGLEGVRYFARR